MEKRDLQGSSSVCLIVVIFESKTTEEQRHFKLPTSHSWGGGDRTK
jgi:hypothetical protein